jgi:hypothetical protein
MTITREELSAMSNDDLYDFVGDAEMDYSEDQALLDCELLRRDPHEVAMRSILRHWNEKVIPSTVPELRPLLDWALEKLDKRKNRSVH